MSLILTFYAENKYNTKLKKLNWQCPILNPNKFKLLGEASIKILYSNFESHNYANKIENYL